jgi:hypothetical protein
VTASIFYVGVLFGAVPFLPTPFRWGFGWKGKPFYFKLSSEERADVIEKLRNSEFLSNGQLSEVEDFRGLH